MWMITYQLNRTKVMQERKYSEQRSIINWYDDTAWPQEGLWYGSPFLGMRKPWTCASVWQHSWICKKINENWQKELTSCRESLAKVIIRRGVFQNDSLSPLLVMCMIPLTHVLHRAIARYSLGGEEEVNLLFMDDLKLYGKS